MKDRDPRWVRKGAAPTQTAKPIPPVIPKLKKSSNGDKDNSKK
jgi:hypothetical protein